MSNNLFGPGGPFHDPFKREREQMVMIKRALGPGYELQQRMKELEAPVRASEGAAKLGRSVVGLRDRTHARTRTRSAS